MKKMKAGFYVSVLLLSFWIVGCFAATEYLTPTRRQLTCYTCGETFETRFKCGSTPGYPWKCGEVATNAPTTKSPFALPAAPPSGPDATVGTAAPTEPPPPQLEMQDSVTEGDWFCETITIQPGTLKRCRRMHTIPVNPGQDKYCIRAGNALWCYCWKDNCNE